MLLFLLLGCKDDTLAPAPDLVFAGNSEPLTALAQEAVALAPDWLRRDLALSLYKLDETVQDDLALLLVDGDDPYLTDEIAFTIAHLSPEVLSHEDFYPQLLVENAALVYERDELLAYVELADEGVPGEDPGYYTTATYRIEEEGGEVVEKTIGRDIYYWYLVHPRMEDELPFYVDGWEPCGNSFQGFEAECATTPEKGQFWREFLWSGAEEECPEGRECPVIRDYVTDSSVDVMWKSKAYDREDNGAIGALINWQIDAMEFGAGPERPIQPNRIYAVGCGNCGEWSDMATAAARSALIPSQNVGARGNDHVWNEFWDDGWKQWEPVNTYVLHWYYYQSQDGVTSEGNPLYAISSSRGDAFISTDRTSDYANSFELEFSVTDVDGAPVDGALVSLFGPIEVYDRDGYWFVGEAYTDAAGIAHFTLGENNEYLFRVDSPIGSNPLEANIITPFLGDSDTVAGQDLEFEVSLEASVPVLDFTDATAPQAEEMLSLDWSMSAEFRLSSPSFMLRGTMSEPVDAGHLDSFLVDQANYDAYVAGEPFDALSYAASIGSDAGSAQVPAGRTWYLVLANDRSIGISAVGDLSLAAGSPDGLREPGSIEGGFVLLPGEHVAVEIGK